MTDQIRTKARTGNIDRTRSVRVQERILHGNMRERTGNVDEPRSGNFKGRNMKRSTSGIRKKEPR